MRRRRQEQGKTLPCAIPRCIRPIGAVGCGGDRYRGLPNGIGAAKAAGLFCVGYANAVTRQLDLSEANVVVESLDDFPLSEVLQIATAQG